MFAVPFLLYLRVNSYAWGLVGQVEVHGGSQALGYKILLSKGFSWKPRDCLLAFREANTAGEGLTAFSPFSPRTLWSCCD